MLAVGTDLMQIRRMELVLERHGQRFLARVYTQAERELCARRAESFAARWAAKEAVAKALGTGIGAVSFRDIEILDDPAGKPYVTLHGRAAEVSAELGLREWAISLAHDGGIALAFVVAI